MFFKQLFPHYCLLCNIPLIHDKSEIPFLCNNCQEDLPIPLTKCIICDTFGAYLCHKCKSQQSHLIDAYTCFQYSKGIQQLIQSFKYSLKPYIYKTFCELIWQSSISFIANLQPDTLCIPMPSGRMRVAQRGYNPVAEITRAFAKRAELPYQDNILLKRAFSIPQTNLSRNRRLTNLEQAFYINPRLIENLNNRHILLMDDVRTTGQTFQQAVKMLEKNCNCKIYALFIAQS